MTVDENVAAKVMICKMCPMHPPHPQPLGSDSCTHGYDHDYHQVSGVVSEVVTIARVLVNGGCSWSEQRCALPCRRWNAEETNKRKNKKTNQPRPRLCNARQAPRPKLAPDQPPCTIHSKPHAQTQHRNSPVDKVHFDPHAQNWHHIKRQL